MEKKGYGIGKRTKREIGTPLMVINIKQEIIDILQIANRRFMYNPKIGILILGDEMYGKNICSSHSQEFYVLKADGHFDDYFAWVDRCIKKLSTWSYSFCPCCQQGAIRQRI